MKTIILILFSISCYAQDTTKVPPTLTASKAGTKLYDLMIYDPTNTLVAYQRPDSQLVVINGRAAIENTSLAEIDRQNKRHRADMKKCEDLLFEIYKTLNPKKKN